MLLEHIVSLGLCLKFLTHCAISRQRDKDGDGKLNFDEYFNGLHDHIHGYDDENADISHIGNMTAAKDRFSKLDNDNDRYASEPLSEVLLLCFSENLVYNLLPLLI